MSLFQVDDNGVVNIHGHLDRDTLSQNWWPSLASAKQQQLRQRGNCVMDLSEVERVDSAGLAWLINAVRDGRQQQVAITFKAVPEKLTKLAKISDAAGLLPVQ